MRSLRFVTADVFTPVPFAGNQLAIVFGADGIATETLQAIANEFNYSETTFVLPPQQSGSRRNLSASGEG